MLIPNAYQVNVLKDMRVALVITHSSRDVFIYKTAEELNAVIGF